MRSSVPDDGNIVYVLVLLHDVLIFRLRLSPTPLVNTEGGEVVVHNVHALAADLDL